MKYKIKDAQGNVINTILAEQSFVEAQYPGRYEAIEEPQPPPPRVSILTPLAFLRRFTTQERKAIRKSTDGNVEDFLYLLERVSGEVDLDDPDTISGLTYLTAIGLLAAGRKEEILA